ncbi:hypothetical protein Y032_0256g351 [Ancylostoma ceylanicum]|uniref:SCP domain-containing protein n=1 Tax=Ancylostoma ceylanicum TaxID=53326 RepID=A0A016SC04_9BILA|nr:hypothetical protein Y032_0256g351 [Ancylostoma ceylanicum]
MRLSLLGVAVFVHLLPNVAVSSATAFGCNDRLISDEWRQMVLDYHNEQRKKVAQGKQKSNDGNMPAGNHIFELVRMYFIIESSKTPAHAYHTLDPTPYVSPLVGAGAPLSHR